jgi:fibronectin-binding autotransporter adhesin
VTIESGYNPSVISVAGGSATVTLNINDQTLTTTTFTFSNSTAVTRTIAFGTTGQITITGNGTTVFTVQTDTGLTTTGSRNVVFTYSGSVGTRTIGCQTVSALNTNSLNYFVQGGTDTVSFIGASGILFRSLDMTGFSGTFSTNTVRAAGNMTLSPTMTLTAVSATWNFSGSSGATQTFTSAGLTLPAGITVSTTGGGTVVFADDVTMPDTQLLTLTSGTLNLNNRTVSVGRFSSSGPTARVLALGTTSVLNITGAGATVWNAANATNFSYTGVGRVNFTYSGSVGTRGIQHGTTSGGTVATKPPPMYVTGGSDILDPKIAGTWYSDLDYTGYTGTVANLGTNFAGNLVLDPSMILSAGANAYTFLGNTATQTITTNGVTTDFPITISGNSTTFRLSEPLVLGNTRALTVNGGNLDANGYDITTGLFSSSGSNIRSLDISDTTMTLNGTGVVWNTLDASNLGAVISNSTVLLSDDTTATKTVRLGTLPELDNIVIGGNTSTANTILLSNANTIINSITSTKTVAQTIGLNGSFTVNSWGIVGTATAPVTLADNGSATVANLHYGGVGTVNVDYYTISYSAATPANTWYALTSNNNIDGGNNTGWIFGAASSSSTFFLVF